MHTHTYTHKLTQTHTNSHTHTNSKHTGRYEALMMCRRLPMTDWHLMVACTQAAGADDMLVCTQTAGDDDMLVCTVGDDMLV